MKRKKSRKGTANSRKKHASETRVAKPLVKALEPVVVKQPRKYADVEISLVNFKSPRRNVKPPKKYADEDFIYYNNVAHDEFGIDPSLLCECALDTSDAEGSSHLSESTDTASETGDNISDLSKLCETVLVTSEDVNCFAKNNQSTKNANEDPAESEDEYIDLSKMCQTQLITSDPTEPQIQISLLRKPDNSEEFILGLSDGELDFASSMRHTEKEVCQKKKSVKNAKSSVENPKSPLVQQTEKNQNATVANRKAQRRKRSRPKSRRKKKSTNTEKKVNVQQKVKVQQNKTNIPTKSTTPVYAYSLRQNVKKVYTENTTRRKKVPVVKHDDNNQRLDEEKVSSENIPNPELHVAKPNTDYFRPEEEKICSENTLDKEVLAAKSNAKDSCSYEERVSQEKIVDKEVLIEKCNADNLKLDEEKICTKNTLNKEKEVLLVAKPNSEHSSLDKDKVYLQNTIDQEMQIVKLQSNSLRPEEEKICPENILDMEVLAANSDPELPSLDEENVCAKGILDKEVPLGKSSTEHSSFNEEKAKPNSEHSSLDKDKVYLQNTFDQEMQIVKLQSNSLRPEEEKICPENILDMEVLAANSDHELPSLDEENVCAKGILDKEVPLVKSSTEHSSFNEEKLCLEKKDVPETKFNADGSRLDEGKVCSENTPCKDVLEAKPNADHSCLDGEKVCSKNIPCEDVREVKSNADYSWMIEAKVCSENISCKDLLEAKSNADYSCMGEEKTCPENIPCEDLPKPKSNAGYSCLDEEQVCSENISCKDLLEAKSSADYSCLGEEKACPENIPCEDLPEQKSKAGYSCLDEEKVCPVNIPYKDVPEAKSNTDHSWLDEEKVNPETIPRKAILEAKSNAGGKVCQEDKEAPVLDHEAEKIDDLRISTDEVGKLYRIYENPKQAMVEENNVEEGSVPDTDSGCDVDMEQGCEEDEQLVAGDSGEEEKQTVNQVPFFSETRIVKVLLHRLEDEEFFRVWKENKQLPKSIMLDPSSPQPANGDNDLKVSSRSKSSKSKNYRRNNWENKKRKLVFLKCNRCNKKFPNELLLNKHKGSHTCVVTIRCRFCLAKFKSIDRFLEHKKSKCDTERVFVCNVCGKNYALKQHLEKHQTPVCRSLQTTKCKVCNKQFHSQRSLSSHLVVHGMGHQPKSYLCEICGALLSKKDTFQSHMEKHMEDLNFVCNQCGKELNSRKKLKKHMKIHFNYESHNLNNNALNSSNKTNDYTCAECGKSFPKLSKLKIHLAVHGMITSLQTFDCKVCRKTFTKSRSLKIHLKTHIVKREYTCSKCSISFDTHEDLKEHGVDCCEKLKFKSEENLSIKEEKPYRCHICEKLFKKPHHLTQHCNKVHLNKVSPTSICEMCGKKFQTSFHLNQHKLMVSCNISSTNYFCKGCGNEYADFSSLKMHFIEAHRIKTDVKCEKCGKEFDDPRKLRSHSVTHKEGYWTSCKHCGKVITKRSLPNHIASVHKSLSLVGGIACDVKVEPVIKVEEQTNLSNDSGILSTCSKLGENVKPNQIKPSVNNPSEKNLLPCRFCGRNLGSRCSLKRHVLNVHKSSNVTESSSNSLTPKAEPPFIKVEEQDPVQDEDLIVASIQTLIENNKQIVSDNISRNNVACGICGKILAHTRSLRRHMISVHKISTNSTSGQNFTKNKVVFNINEQSLLKVENKNVSVPHMQFNEARIKLEPSESTGINNRFPLVAEQQMSIQITRRQVDAGQNNQSYEPLTSNLNLSPQTEQQVPEAPTSISCLSQNEYQGSEISNDSILMSQMINAQNYKIYLPNTSFLNSQCQNIEASSGVNSPIRQKITETDKIITQPLQQNHYALLENTSMSYLSHDLSTSREDSLPVPDFMVPKVSAQVKIPPPNQYPNSETNVSIDPTSLLEDKHLNLIDTIMCSPSVQDIDSDSLINIPIDESLPLRYDDTQELDANVRTASTMSYNYFTAPGCPETLAHESHLPTKATLPPLCYQSPEVSDINLKITQQEVPAENSNTYVLHQFIQPQPAQNLSISHYQSPGATNTYIIIQPKLESESLRTPKTIISRSAPYFNELPKRVETSNVQLHTSVNPPKKLNFVCNLCELVFHSKLNYDQHMVEHGFTVTSTHFRCTICKQSFDLKHKCRAEEHSRKHTGEVPYTCRQCPETFTTNRLLSRHTLAHKLVPIKCHVCDLTVSSNYSLRRHLKLKHQIDTQQPNQSSEAIKKEYSSTSALVNELSSFISIERPASRRQSVEPLPQQPYVSQEISDIRESDELASLHSYSYNFEEANGINSDIVLDLNDLRDDDFVPDAMETVLKLENW